MLMRSAWVVLAAALASAIESPAQNLPPGQLLEAVTTVADATQSYALYLPSTYTADRAWPILIGFHPGARGRAIVETYREAAERYGLSSPVRTIHGTARGRFRGVPPVRCSRISGSGSP